MECRRTRLTRGALAVASASLLAAIALSALGPAPTHAAAQASAAPTTGMLTVGPDGNVWFTEPEAERIGRVTPAGVITEFSADRGFAHPTWITAGPDGNLWFPSGWYGEQIGRITPRGAVRTFWKGLYPHGMCCGEREVGLGPMVPGGDGNVWFTEINGIGRITPAGAIRLFDERFPTTHPFAIAAGPDGNMWFAEQPLNWAGARRPTGAIGRITPAGVVRRFSAGITSAVGPFGDREAVVAGPDGNMWFTEAGGIGRITPAGRITEFRTSSPPAALATGPDGNVWFATSDGRSVGRISPAGVLTAFPTGARAPTRGPHVGLAAGSDGNMWFTLRNRIARVTPEGTVTQFWAGLSRGASPDDLIAGPDGNVWFNETNPSRIGRITPAGLITEFSPIAAVAAVHQRGSRAVAVRLSCPAGASRPCRGTLGLEGKGGHQAGLHRFSVAPAGHVSIVLPLTPAWRRFLDTRGRLDLGLKLLPMTWNKYAYVWRWVTLRRLGS